MIFPLKHLIVILVSYALGCFNTAYYLVRLWLGEDIRNLGSGTAGGRNVGRQLGVPGFLIAAIGDGAKGALAAWLALYFDLGSAGVLLAIAAAVAGHVWPAQLGFRGGKGLATLLGGGLVFDYRIALVTLVIAGLFIIFIRRSTPSALLAITLMPATAAFLEHPLPSLLAMIVVIIPIMAAHRVDINAILGRVNHQGRT